VGGQFGWAAVELGTIGLGADGEGQHQVAVTELVRSELYEIDAM
jgi:hypothetical protein